MLGNMKVGQKIMAIVMLVGLLLAALLTISYFSFRELHRGLDEVRNEGVPNAIVAKDMQMQVVQIQQWLTDISATRGQDGLDDGFKEAEAAHTLFLEDLAKIRAAYQHKDDQQGTAQADQLKERMSAWYATGKRMAQAYIDGGAPAGNQIMGEFDAVSAELQKALVPVIDAQVNGATVKIVAAEAKASTVQMLTLAGIVVAVVMLALGGRFLAIGVTGPLTRMSALIGEIVSHKDFSAQLSAQGNDEIAEVSRGFNQLVAMLGTMLQSLNQDVHRLDTTAAELATAINASSHSFSATSASAASMASGVEEMSASLGQMSDNTSSALSIVAASTQHSEEGGRIIGTAITDMQKITTSVQDVADAMSTLDQQTGQISNIVGVIREVADQTNLLALNAAIEAARAGEQGRGFAVVADEVRKLAERTADSTNEIATMISAIQKSAQTAVERMAEAVSQANNFTHLTRDAGQSIEAIRSGANEVASAFQDIAHAISEQSSAGKSLAQQVEHVARAADENNEAVRHTAQAAKALEVLATEIRGRIDQFKV